LSLLLNLVSLNLREPIFGIPNLTTFLSFPQLSDPLIAMDYILDTLKLLDYENKFCRQK